MSLAGLRLRYLIGKDDDDGDDGAFTIVGYDATQPPSKGVGAKYVNLFDEKNSGAYGPYLTTSDTAQQYTEGQCDPAGAGFWKNVSDQIKRAKNQGFSILGDIDNRDSYHNADVLKVYNQAALSGLKLICKNAGMSDLGEYSTELLKHPAVIGCIIEKGDVTPGEIVIMRIAAGRPDLPVWFVSFGDGRTWAEQTAAKIRAAQYINIGVTYSSQGEYGSSEDILVPLTAAGHPLVTAASLRAGIVQVNLSGSLQNPAFSPDGNSIVFTRFRSGYNAGHADLYILNLDTGANTVLIADGSANVSEPGSTWSKNGEIIFSSDRDGPDQAISIKSDSSGRRALTAIAPAMAWEPSRAPNGTDFVYERHDIEARGRIALVQNGQEQLITAEAGDCRQPCWSPRGDLIVYQKHTGSGWNLWLYDVASGQSRQFTRGNEETDATFSPDGTAVLYSHGLENGAELVLAPVNGGVSQHFNDAAFMGAPSISPNGEWIACESSTSDPDGGHGTQLMFVPISPASSPITTAPVMTTSAGAFPYGPTIKKLMLARGYPWFPDQNVVTVETMNDDGSLCNTGPNTFDDQKMVLDGDGNVIGGPWDATDHPGAYWTEHPMASGGAFIISLGPQACWTPGQYHGFEVWRQAPDSTLMGTRDPNDAYKRIGPPIAHGDIGVHHHGGYNLSKGDIATAAAGCQVIRLVASQAAFMHLTKQCPRYLADPQGYRLTATVLTAQDVLDAYASPSVSVPSPTPSPLPPVSPVPAQPNFSAGLVLDTAEDVTRALPALKALGYTTVIRYLTTNTSSSKCFKPAEARACAAADMRVALVFEIWGGVNNFQHGDINAATGAQHAAFCNGYVQQLGVPNGAGIYFAIDTDVTASKIKSLVIPYFQAVRATLAGQYRVGAYAGGAVLQAALDAGCISLPWLAAPTKWNGSKAFAASGKAVMVQQLPQSIAGLDVDPDVRMGDIGDFVPFAAVPLPAPQPQPPVPLPQPLPMPAPAPQPPAPAPSFSQDGLATWYSDNANASGSPVNNATDMTAAHNTLPFGTLVKVTRTDTSASVMVGIQDRGGPALSGNRIIDLRPAAATVLDMIDAGVVPVHIETVQSVIVQSPPTPVPPIIIPLSIPPVVPPVIINLPSTQKDAAIMAALTDIAAVVKANPQLQADLAAIFGGMSNQSAPSTTGTFLGAIGKFFGVWAIPLAFVGGVALYMLQRYGTVTDPTTVTAATGGVVVGAAGGLVVWLQKAFNVFGQIATAIQKGNKP